MKKYLLEIIVFITGAVVMILELVGTRILAPYVGSSIIVWTSLIGIILGALSFGYAKGGELADKKPSYRNFSLIIFVSAVNIALVSVFREYILSTVQFLSNDLRITSVISATILFAPPSFFLGMVVPFAVKLKLKNLAKTGRTAGNLYAASTVGSIFGTFSAGFYLIAILGSGKILILLSVLLLVASYLAFMGQPSTNRSSNLFLFFSIVIIGLFVLQPASPWFFDTDTLYNRVILQKAEDPETKRPFLALRTGRGYQSAMFLDNDDELLIEYTKYYRLGDHFNADIKNALMIGGGGYSYPKDFLKKHNEAEIDVVEIDPAVTELAKEFFRLPDDTRLAIYHEDGRNFLNRNDKKYDAIYIDAYSDISIPFHLTTIETVEAMFKSLNVDGVVILNIIGSIEGEAGKFLRAELATYKEVFPQVYLFPVLDSKDAYKVQNIALVALKSIEKPNFESENAEIEGYLSHLWTKEVPNDILILTDDFAPVDQYMVDVVSERD